jgi:D-glycero-alpha-D-manno-heptose-7-phosphate kinase
MAGMQEPPVPWRIVNATAPIRICDIGGWTDTWFAEHGQVFNIGVHPCVEVQVKVHPVGVLPGRVVLDVGNYGDRYVFELQTRPGRHPLLEAAIDEIGLPAEVSVEISIFSETPAGSSTGTSASATVALIGALDALSPGRLTPLEVAHAAHRVETERLGIQSGIQDQLCAAYGGINFIEISSYPDASVTPLSTPPATWWELERRIALVSLGRTHVSSALHHRVIARLAREGPGAPPLEQLRQAADAARDALSEADFGALGRAMTDNTEAQRQLHPGLVCADAESAIEVAASAGASGWKVNGAGGDGGSLTVLCGPDAGAIRALGHLLHRANPLFRVIPTHLSLDGLRVWETDV